MYLALPTLRLADHEIATCLAISTTLNIDPGPGGSRMTNHDDVYQRYYPILESWFPKRWAYCTLVALYPSSQIVAHADAPIVGTRYHLPIALNPGCWVFHDGAWQGLLLGQVYRMDPTKLHGAVNWGTTIRLHLLIDQEE